MSKRIVLVIAMVLAIVGMSINSVAQGTYYRRSRSYGSGSYGVGSSRAIEYAKAKAREEAKRKDNNVKTEDSERQAKSKTDKGNETFSSQNNEQIIVQVSEEKVVTRSGKIFYKHIVSERQSLSLISNAYGVTVNEIYEANPTAKKGLKIGQTLLIPAKGDLVSDDKKISNKVEPSVLSASSQETKPSSVTSNHNDEVSLVVDGEGPDKTEATKNALRSAIEQAYGTFVSANTTILNDDLVKDEIATVSSGNIKSYRELSSTILSNGQTSVTLSAIVSIGQLISYAQSKGASAEFAGQTFMMNMKMRELNKKNEISVLNHLLDRLKAVNHTFYDYSIEVGDPIEANFYTFQDAKLGMIYDSGYGDIHFYSSYDGKYETLQTKTLEKGYKLPITLVISLNNNYKQWSDDVISTLSTLSLTTEEKAEYNSTKTEFFELYLFDYHGLGDLKVSLGRWYQSLDIITQHFYLRNNVVKDFLKSVNYLLLEGLNAEILEKYADGKENNHLFYGKEFFIRQVNDDKNFFLLYGENHNYCMHYDKYSSAPWSRSFPYRAPDGASNDSNGFYYRNDTELTLGWKYKIPLVFKKDDLYLLNGIEVRPYSE